MIRITITPVSIPVRSYDFFFSISYHLKLLRILIKAEELISQSQDKACCIASGYVYIIPGGALHGSCLMAAVTYLTRDRAASTIPVYTV
jgi:hypothetical protein